MDSRTYLCRAANGRLVCSARPEMVEASMAMPSSIPQLRGNQLEKLSKYVTEDLLGKGSGLNPHLLQQRKAPSRQPVKAGKSGQCPMGYGSKSSNSVNAKNIVFGQQAGDSEKLRREIGEGMTRNFVEAAPKLPTINLKQNNFKTGTYRIKTPGNYHFKSDVVFDANFTKAGAGRPDLPINGHWFASISIECDGPVNIYGNGYRLSQSVDDMIADTPGAFALIVLGNSMFSGGSFSTANAIFPDSATSYVPAHNVKIYQLNFDTCNHFAIRGSNNNNVEITYCTFRDEQIGPIAIQSPNGLIIDHCYFEGAPSPVRVLDDKSANFALQNFLTFLNGLGVPGAGTYLADLNNYAAANPARFTKIQTITSANYAILLTAGITPAFDFPVDTIENDISRELAGFPGTTPPGTNVLISNSVFSKFISDPVEGVTIGSNIPRVDRSTSIAAFPVLITATFPQWNDAFNSSGVFAPNAFLKALAFAMSAVYSGLPPSIAGILPANALTIFGAILANDGPTFFANAAPIVGAGGDGSHIKGLFGIRMIGMNGVTVNNIAMNDFDIRGARGIDPATLPGYALVTNPQPVIRYRGTDLWFMSIETCQNVSVNKLFLADAVSDYGYCFGVHIAADDSNITVQNALICNMDAPNTVASATTDKGDVFGIEVMDNNGPILIKNVVTKNLTGGGSVQPFPSASSSVVLVNTVSY